ncbi:MAG: hypothetical protein M1587_07655 [Thaumarchaeota archaeon]|nr:hypothetical protein [Nitrososphaerota archaeon]
MPTAVEKARYVNKRGFVCSSGDHVLYCPDLTKADKSQPFYLHCSKHYLLFRIDLSAQSQAFIEDFPHGCKES